jgi:hypothetical protein
MSLDPLSSFYFYELGHTFSPNHMFCLLAFSILRMYSLTLELSLKHIGRVSKKNIRDQLFIKSLTLHNFHVYCVLNVIITRLV